MFQNIGFIASEDIAEQGHWNAAIYVGAPLMVKRVSTNGIRIKDTGKSIEGWRDAGKQEQGQVPVPVFRQPDLAPMRFFPSEEHWQAPQIEGPWCLKPGDVVVNRTLPFRAAWVTSSLHHHPIDANCIIIRVQKADRALGFWIALCLNQQIYTSYLAAQSSGSALTRINLKMLSDLKLPPVPGDASAMATEVWVWNNAMLENSAVLARLKAEVENYMLRDILQLGIEIDWEKDRSLTPGKWFPGDDVEDSLIPWNIDLSHFQKELQKNLGWVRLSDLLADESPSRVRLPSAPEDVPLIRISNLDADMAINWAKGESKESASPRVYQDPLESGEVLVSTLVSNSRVAFTGNLPITKMYVTDHLERLHFRETPGAWALLLQTSAVRTQLERSAIGTAQQFASRASIQKLMLPMVPREIRMDWEETLGRHHQHRAELETQWRTLWPRAQALFDTVLRNSGSERGGKNRKYGGTGDASNI